MQLFFIKYLNFDSVIIRLTDNESRNEINMSSRSKYIWSNI